MSCFISGTLITTKQGDVPVENLKPGQMVLTRDHGFQPVRCVGVKQMTSRFLLDNPHLRPVLVRKGAFGRNLPLRDMMLSPNTRLPYHNDDRRLLSGASEEMIAIKHLVDHDGILAVDTIGVDFVHVMFDQHQILAANGVWTEAFNPRDYSLKNVGNAQRNEVLEVFPSLRRGFDRIEARTTQRRVVRRGFIGRL